MLTESGSRPASNYIPTIITAISLLLYRYPRGLFGSKRDRLSVNSIICIVNERWTGT